MVCLVYPSVKGGMADVMVELASLDIAGAIPMMSRGLASGATHLFYWTGRDLWAILIGVPTNLLRFRNADLAIGLADPGIAT
jgi:hypothetical protein